MIQVINELKQINESYTINRYLIYELFFDKLFISKRAELEAPPGIRPGVDILRAFIGYAKTMSYAELAGISINLSTGIDTLQAAKACVNHHQTFAEYFMAKSIVEDLDHYYHDLDKSFYNLSVSYLKENKSILDFICEILQSYDEEIYLQFIHTLYVIVIDKSTNEFGRNNALTILLQLDFPLSGYDLSDLSLQVNFSDAVLHRTNFSNTKLSKSYLSRAFMHEANLLNTDLRDCNFSVLPHVQFKGKIDAYSVFNHGQYYGVLCNNQIDVFNFHDRSHVKTVTLEFLEADMQVISMQIL